MQLWRLASPKSTEQAGRIETQGKVNVSVLNPKAVWRQNSFFPRGPQPFLIRPLTG